MGVFNKCRIPITHLVVLGNNRLLVNLIIFLDELTGLEESIDLLLLGFLHLAFDFARFYLLISVMMILLIFAFLFFLISR